MNRPTLIYWSIAVKDFSFILITVGFYRNYIEHHWIALTKQRLQEIKNKLLLLLINKTSIMTHSENKELGMKPNDRI